jgi:2-iminobutanoate/2-iminopropanoate deaminase
MKKCIHAPGAPPALGPYSHAVRAGGFVFVSGQGPFQPDGSGVLEGTLQEQSRLTIENLKRVLAAADATLADVVKTTVFLTDMDQFQNFNKVYREYFGENSPARSCIQAAALPGGIQVEIEAIAYRPVEHT